MNKKQPQYSIVIPVFNSANTLQELTGRIRTTLTPITEDFEIILINDGSEDNSWGVIQTIGRQDDRIIVMEFTRNFGQHNALMAGFKKADGEYIITLDDDLQNPPEEIPKLIKEIEKGYDVVYGTYPTDQHGFLRNLTSILIRALFRYAIPEMDNCYSQYRIMKSMVAREVSNFDSPFNFVDGYISWVTQKVSGVPVAFNKRQQGKSGYNIRKLMGHTINILTTFSTLPVRLATGLGLLFSFIGTLMAIYYLVMKFVFSDLVPPGYTSIIIALLISQGIVLLLLGVLGEYVAKVNFKSTKKAKYIIRN